ncbi:MAG: AMIN domain-containing protein [Deltaproteobacteria bacterium]|nr:AMIN domain-containing protein [Deltaproteobacteria bacterium]
MRTLALAIVLLARSASADPALAIRSITTQTFGAFTRVTVETSRPAKPTPAHLAAEPESGRPERIALDFSGAALDVPGPSRIDVRDGRIDAVRFGRTNAGGARVVVDLVQPARYRALRHVRPDRIELDVLAPDG